MTGSTSVYAINESEPPKFKPGEESAAAAFIGVALWLIIDTLFCVNRVFKKRQGLYFWSIFLGCCGLLVDSIGVILKYLTPNSTHLWVLYSLFLMGGWTTYAPCQLLVLYSRLHLVNDVLWIRKVALGSIIFVTTVCMLPTWVCNWHSYNPNHAISSLWSPRTAIVERYTQIFLTLEEAFISGIYIWSLLGILKRKVTVRQRRVMTDLIYVNVMAVTFDILTVIFIYMNQLGISHPIQTFSYALKFKLEFLVLNQLMAVAARGIQRKSWEEKRYFHADGHDEFSAEARRWAEEHVSDTNLTLEEDGHNNENLPEYNADDLRAEIKSPTPPEPARTSNRNSVATNSNADRIDPHNPNAFSFSGEPGLGLRESLLIDNSDQAEPHISHSPQAPSSHQPSIAYSGETLHPGPHEPREESPHLFHRQVQKRKRRTMEIIREHVSGHHRSDRDREKDSSSRSHHRRQSRDNDNNNSTFFHPGGSTPSQHNSPNPNNPPPNTNNNGGNLRGRRPQSRSSQRSHLDFNPNQPFNATLRRPNPRKRHDDDDEDDEEEIGVHMWERRGTILLCAPWMEKDEALKEREKANV